jgi:hypothetical protein
MGQSNIGNMHGMGHDHQNGHNGFPNPAMHMGNMMRPNLNKNESKKSGGRKPTTPGEKKSNQPKSPAVKRVKEVVYVKLFVV